MMNTLWLWLLLLAVVAALAWRWWQQQAARATAPALAANDRFGAVAAISPVQWEMLRYLNNAFPGRPVLFRAGLSQLVTVRQAQSRLAAQQRLAQHVVDYVVCNRDGKAVYAFELDAAHEDPDEAQLDATEKHRVLKTAGIRLIRIKRSTQHMPPPEEFRRRLRTAEIDPTAVEAAAPAAPAEAQDTQPVAARHAAARETEPMSLSGLMDLPPAADDGDPWGSPRRRS